ncbi:endoribonuclease L-PSP [Colletotrichum karsti]|uniref:Endoribonuclease L-PSP n=1 Tax=Colletotrichum karsti TaxID=1095194 RepID=A0A9P6IEM0_9PEZI|nr:endoribonuclease L-PSP [Colletotrichum karsti]KAF9879096.1 endoribonuclease L-PSP [Colletotrichum karsti]
MSSSLLLRSVTRISSRALPRPSPTRVVIPRIRTQAFSVRTANMSDQSIVFTKNAPAPVGPYSQAVKTPTAIYCSGQIPLNPEGVLIDGTITDKTKQCITNLQAVLTEAGSSIAKVVKVNIFLADMGDFAEMNGEYEKWFTHKPARSCVAVKTLPKNVEVEIEAIALP